MKTTKLTLALAGLLIAGGAIVSSCKKSTTTPTPAQDTNASTASDNNMAEQHSNDVENIGAESIDEGSLSTFRLANGGLSVASTNTYNVTGFGTGTVTVTFYQYAGNDGHTRNGSIIYTISNGTHYRDPGMVITVSTSTLNPYTVDNNTVTISKTITNNGFNSNNNMNWSISTNLSIAKASGGTFTWNTINRTHELLNTNATTYDGTAYAAAYTGTVTPITWANTATVTPYNGAIVEINGSASGTSADGVAYSVTASNVVRNHNCTPFSGRLHFHPFVAGTVTFTPAGKTPRIINYGNGACDTTYTISIGSWSITITW
ncbi:MAG TPA: hypothetical protein VNX01_13005 [Bacteroidia bacterium]|jgi:hypothetical protein|nr:hypothetical protein [Bacteroidia bacterium]